MEHPERLVDLVQAVRDIVTQPRKQHSLMQDRGIWAQVGFCLYSLEDTQLAIEAYETKDEPTPHGDLYLNVYGLLQALVLQQEALDNLAEALGLDVRSSKIPRLAEVRTVRNDVAGHPTKRGRGRALDTSHHAIVRVSMSLGGFEIIDIRRNGDYSTRYITIAELIRDNEEGLCLCLHNVRQTLEDEMAAHQADYRGMRLADLLPDVRNYHVEKLREASRGGTSEKEWAKASLESIEGVVRAFTIAVDERGLGSQALPAVGDQLERLQYPLQALRAYLTMETDKAVQTPDDPAAEIFAWFIKHQLDRLHELAQEIDAEYEADSSGPGR